MASSKRYRSSNFSVTEKEILLELIDQYRNIIENKKTDSVSLKEKESVWNEIQENYNALSESYRTVQTLKNCWDNLKRRCRKSHCEPKPQLFNSEREERESCEIAHKALYSKVVRILEASLADNHMPLISKSGQNIEVSSSDNHVPLISKGGEIIEVFPSENHLPLISKVGSILDTSPTGNHLALTDSPVIHSIKSKNDSLRKRPLVTKNAEDTYLEEKTKLLKLGIEHAIEEEKRKSELHALEIEEKKLKIELLKLQILKEKEKG